LANVTPIVSPSAPDPAASSKVADEQAANATACKKIVASLSSGSLKPGTSPPADQLSALGQNTAASEALTCLACASDNQGYCNLLPEPSKGYCSGTWALARDIKTAPKTSVKSYVLYSYCLRTGTSKAVCDKGLELMIKGNASRCKELATDVQRQVCVGILKEDPKACDRLTSADDRLGCSVLMSGDASRCPKDSKPCIEMAHMIAAAEKNGLEGLQDITPALAAAKLGKSACAKLVDAMEQACATKPAAAADSMVPPTMVPATPAAAKVAAPETPAQK
jgi:hypothetical protein